MIMHVALYRMLEYLGGEKGWKVMPYRFAARLKWRCLRHI